MGKQSGSALLKQQKVPSQIANKIDHTLLRADASSSDIKKLCQEARHYGFATVCINPIHLPLASTLLQGSATLPITVVGFPLGASSTASKVFETREAIKAGAKEIDMVLQIGALKNRDYALVFQDISQVVEAAQPYPVKVIIETSLLDGEQKVTACVIAKAAGAAFVKTSTGFGTAGATEEDIKLMRKTVGPELGVKASGGVKTYRDLLRMVEAGATRIGASASVQIVEEELAETQAKSKNTQPPNGPKR